MTDKAEQLVAQVLQLPRTERTEVLSRLIRAMDESDTDVDANALWDEEIERRIDDMEAGRVKPMSWEEARAQIVSNEPHD